MGAIHYWIFRLGIGERVRCNDCNSMIHGTEKDTSKQPILIFEEAIRADDTIGRAYCEKCAKENHGLTVDRENQKIIEADWRKKK